MPRFSRWLRSASQKFPRASHRRQKGQGHHFRPLCLESLEDRRLLAYNITETGSLGSETLVISKATSDTAALTMTADALGNVTLADPNNTFTGGPFLGVTINANSVVIDPALAGVAHLKFDFSANNSQTNNLTIGDLSGATIPGIDVLSKPAAAGSGDVVTFSTPTIDTGSSTAANAGINLTNVDRVTITESVAIKTAQLPTDNPGPVNLGYVLLGAAGAGENLSVDTSTNSLGVNGGAVAISADNQGPGQPNRLNNLSINTSATAQSLPGTISIFGGVFSTGNQTYDGPVVLATVDTGNFQSANGAITFDSTVDGNGNGIYDLNASAQQGTVDFKGRVGGLTNSPTLSFVDVGGLATEIDGGSVSTSSYQRYSPLTITRNTTFASGPGAMFFSTIDGSGGLYNIVISDTSLGVLNISGDSIGGSGSVPDIGSLDVVGQGTALINVGTVRTAGPQTYASQVMFTGNAALTSTGYSNDSDPSQDLTPGIVFGSTVDGFINLLASCDGVIDFSQVVGEFEPLTSLTCQGSSKPTAGLTQFNGSVTTSGTQTYNNPVLLANNPVFTSTQGNIAFNSTVGGNSALTTSSPDTTAFNALVSITTLTVGSAGGSGIAKIAAGTVNTVGPQTYNVPLVLANNPVLSSIQNSLTFNSTVGGNSALSTDSAGTTTFNALVSIAGLTAGNFNGGSTVNINTSTINTTGSQKYNAPLLLANNPELISSQGNITFNSTVGGNSTLTTNCAGTTTFNALVSIAGLSVNSAQDIDLGGGTITTTNAQTYNGLVLLDTNNTLTSTAGGDMTFTSAVNASGGSTRILTLYTSGKVTFEVPVSHEVIVNGSYTSGD